MVSEDDVPLSKKLGNKKKQDDWDDDQPIVQRSQRKASVGTSWYLLVLSPFP